MPFLPRRLGPLLGLLALGAVAGLPCRAQTGASVTVNAAAPAGALPATGVGVNTAVWDGNLLDAAVPGLLSQAGVTVLRFPGGSTSDVYHWQNNSATAGTGQYINPADTFDAFMGVAQKAGATPVITVNYGSNAAGNAGGDPNEAAAWVNY
ncbi:MAG: cellulose-binding protein, partial [Armatimonadetes bacterium]|nr:cellulose-binding protein [Armatimonadota bacterium]